MKEKILKNRKIIDIVIIIVVAMILGMPLLNSGVDVYLDDGIQHIARAYGTYGAIKENGIFAKVIPSFANNFGYSWDLFYGPLSTMGIILIKLICGNYIVAYKIFVLIVLILSGYCMYKFMLEVTENSNAALLASILYMSFPYHLTDLYTRNALGEYVSFVFIPLVFLGLYNLFNSTENPYYLVIGAVGLILTHNLSTVMVAFFAFLYLLINIKKLKSNKIRNSFLLNFLFIMLTTMFFWGPLLETKFSAEYFVYQDNAMSIPEDMAKSGLTLKDLFVTKSQSSFIFELGLPIIIMIGLSVMAFRIVDDKFKEIYDFSLIISIISLWMSTKYFPWKILPYEFSIFQFPWRFLEIAAFFLSVICSINMLTIIRKFNYKDVAIISIVTILYVSSFCGKIYINKDIQDINNYDLGNISGKENECSAGIAWEEYLPERAFHKKFYIATREDAIYVIQGKAIIENEEKNGSNYKADIKTLDAEYTLFELPYLYYPGYEIRIDGVITKYFETGNGFIGIVLGEEDNVKLEVSYTGTNIMKISALISFISFLVFCIYVRKKY